MTGFNKALYRSPNRKNEEPEPHKKSRERLEAILELDGWDLAKGEKPKITLATPAGMRTYYPDILAFKGEPCLIAEIDGESHSDSGKYQSRAWKDEIRDEAFLIAGFHVARFSVEELIGEFSLSLSEIRIAIRQAVETGIRKVGDKTRSSARANS